ncbi:unnamed protein product [Brachionus calyciflorus]|uniref:DH domain-containing protein n=1 Tax=Brachionus calyciflorus TaxID=104777 RepID=A0A813P2Z5_9BILA|nr:unnamed protein product [Brachionus calyciflorus]
MSHHNSSKNINITNVILSPASPFTSQQQINKLMNTSSSPLNNPSLRNPNLINSIPIKPPQNKINRHTIAIPNDSYEYKYHRQQSFESSNNNSSPLSKTPDSTNENWLSINESLPVSKTIISSNLTGSSCNLADSDHEMLESNATGNSGGGDESADDDLDSGFHNASAYGTTYMFNDEFDDNTTKRLKTFVTTTLHNEKLYLEKLKKLLKFKEYLEENFNGTETDISVLFSGIQQIYLTHDIVAQKLQEYLNNLNELLQNNSKTSPVNTRLNQVVGSSRQATNLSPTTLYPNNSNIIMKESFLSSALNLLANIMEISFPVYLEFLKNYPKSMTILNKLEKQTSKSSISSISRKKTLSECQTDFNKFLLNSENLIKNSNHNNKKTGGLLARFTQHQNHQKNLKKDPFEMYYNDTKNQETFDLTKIFTEDILRRPTKLFEFIFSLKEECILASNDLPNDYCASLKSNIKSLFENESSKNLRERVFNEINRNIMPKEVRKNEDVVELMENNNERKLRHLILYGDCLVCCRLKKDKRQLKWFIPIDQLEVFTDEYKSAKSENELRHLREEVVNLRAEQENELAIQSSRLKLIVRANPLMSSSNTSNSSNSSSSLSAAAFFSNGGSLVAALSSSVNNLTSSGLTSSKNNSHHQNIFTSNPMSSSPTQQLSNTFVFLFTSEFERNAWMEEINGAIYALKSRKTTTNLQHSDIESRINNLKKIEEPPKIITSSYTGSLELLVRKTDKLEQPNKVFVAVELKSCGSYLEVAQTNCSELTSTPVWEENYNLELQSVDSLRIILYSQTSGKALAIGSKELKIDSNIN